MNESVRWIVVLGCLCIAALEAPQCCLQLVQDSAGSYPLAQAASSAPQVAQRHADVALASRAVQSVSLRTPTPLGTEEERDLATSDERTDAGVRLASHR